MSGNRFRINDRIYEADDKTGTHIYPVEGKGVYQLTGLEHELLGRLNSKGYEAAKQWADRHPLFQEGAGDFERVVKIWREAKDR